MDQKMVKKAPEFIGEVVEQEDGPPLVTVRADTLIPMLVYVRKLFKCIETTNKNGMSRFMRPEDFNLSIYLKGFTPEDFNALQSLNNTVGTDLAALLDKAADNTPQMKRTNEFGTLGPRRLKDATEQQRNLLDRELQSDSGVGQGSPGGERSLRRGEEVDSEKPDSG